MGKPAQKNPNGGNTDSAVYADTEALVSISQAAGILDVSIDTIRRWDKNGTLKSSRPDGKNRFFAVKDLEAIKFAQPLTIGEASEQLGVSVSTLRRLEKKGVIKPERNGNGERLYNKQTLQDFLRSEYFVRQKEVEQEILKPLSGKPDPGEKGEQRLGHDPAIYALLGEHHLNIEGLKRFRKRFVGALAVIGLSFVLIVVVITILFLLFPASTSKVLGYYHGNPSTKHFSLEPQASMLARQAKPFSGTALRFIEAVNPKLREKIAPRQPIQDVNDVLATNADGDIVSKYTFTFPDTSYFKVPDQGLIINLNSDFVHGKQPGLSAGDLAVLPITTDLIKDGSITKAKLAPGLLIGGGGGGGVGTITEILAGQGLAGGGSVGAVSLGINLQSGSGLEANASGLSINRGCANGETLKWNGSGWGCAGTVTPGGTAGGDLTGIYPNPTVAKINGNPLGNTSVTAGNLLVGSGTAWVSQAITGDVFINAVGATTVQADAVALGTDTTGNYLSNAVGGNGMTVSGAGSENATATINLVLNLTGSGLQADASGLSLSRACASGEVLKWNGSAWNCGSAGTLTVKEGGVTTLSPTDSMNFSASDFAVTAAGGGQADVAIDYANSKITRSTQNETISGAWIMQQTLTFTGMAPDIDTGEAKGLTLQGRAASSFQTTTGDVNINPAGSGSGLVLIGQGTSSATPDLLVLDRKDNDVSDPTGTPGAMYYNIVSGKFRCFENGAWTNCIGAGSGGSGGSSVWSDLTQPTANLALNMNEFTSNFNWNTSNAISGQIDGLLLNITNDGTSDPNTQRLLVLKNNDNGLTDNTGSGAPLRTDELLHVENADDSRVNYGIRVTNSNSLGVVNIAFDASGSGINNALNIGDNRIFGGDGTIQFNNFQVNGIGTVTIAGGSAYTSSGATIVSSAGGNSLLLVSGSGGNQNLLVNANQSVAATSILLGPSGGVSFQNSSGNLLLDANGANQVQIGGVSTGDVLLAGGVGAFGCTVTNANGNLQCTGNITNSTNSGTLGFWTRSGTTLQPATGGDNVQLTGAGTLSYAAGSTGNFDQSLSSGTFKTGTGAVSLNGDTTIAAGKNLTLATGTGLITQNYNGNATAASINANSLTSGTALAISATSLQTGKGLAITGGTAMTSGNLFQGSGTFIHTVASENGSLASLAFTDASTNINAGGISSGINIASTVSTSGAGTKTINGVNVAAPTLSGCTSGACTINGYATTTSTNTNANIVQNGLNVQTTGTSTLGTINGLNIGAVSSGAATENGILFGAGWDLNITTATNTDLTVKSNGSGILTLDSTGTGAVNLGTDSTNAKTVTIGNTNSPGASGTVVNLNVSSSVATGGLNLGDNANTKTIDLGGVDNNGADTIRIATNGSTADTITIGNNTAGTALTLDAGNTGKIQIGNSAAAHTIQIGTDATTVQGVSIGSITASSSTRVDAGSTGLILNATSGSVSLQTTTGGNITITPAGSGNILHTLDADTNAQFNSTYASDTTQNVVDINSTNIASASTGTLNLLAVRNLNEASATGTPDSLVYLQNADTNETVSQGLFVENSSTGTISSGILVQNTSTGTLTSGLTITNTTTGTLTNGVIFTGTIGTDITTASGRTLTVNTGGTGTIQIGVDASNAKTITIGNTTSPGASGSVVNIDISSSVATGGLNLGDNANAKTIDIGGVDNSGTDTIRIATNATAADGVTIGNANTGTTLNLDAGTAATALQIGNSANAHGIQIGANNTGANAILLGSNNSASVLNLDAGTAATALQIGNSTTNHGIQIGAGSGATNAITIGNATATSTLILDAGTAASAIQIGNTAGAHDIKIGNGGTAAQIVTIGSTSSSSALTLNSGSGNISLNPGGAGSIVNTLDADSNAQFNGTVGSDVTLNLVDIGITNTASASTGTLNGLAIRNINNVATGNVDNLIYAVNSDNNGTVANGLLIDQAGGTITSGITILNSGGTLTTGLTIGSGSQAIGTGLSFASTGLSTDISLQNGETIDNDTNNQIKLGFGASGGILLLTNGSTLNTDQATFNLLNTAATTINFGGAATTALNIGSTTTGLNSFNADVDMNFTGSENLTLANTSASTDQLSITATSMSTNAIAGLHIVAGAITGSSIANSGIRVDINNAPPDSGDLFHGIVVGGAAQTTTEGEQNGIVFAPANASNTAGTLNGLKIWDNFTPGGAATENAMNIGTGWDTDLLLGDASPVIKLGATDNTAELKINNMSNNNLLSLKDLSTNFGSALTVGAAISRNSMFAEEFNQFKATNCSATTALSRGDYGSQGALGCAANTGELSSVVTNTGAGAACTFSTNASAVNGTERITANTTVATAVSSICGEYLGSSAIVNNNIYLASNLPVVTTKISMGNAVDANHTFYVGLSDDNPVLLTSLSKTNGVYFSNCPAGGACTGNLQAVNENASTGTSIDCGVAVPTNKMIYLRIEVRGASNTHFFYDMDTTNGITETECGSGISASAPTVALTSMMTVANKTQNSTATDMSIDFFRTWQDDNVPATGLSGDLSSAVTPDSTFVPQNITLATSKDGKFIINGDDGQPLLGIDQAGNATLKGSLSSAGLNIRGAGGDVSTVDDKGNAAFSGTVKAGSLAADQVIGADIGQQYFSDDAGIESGDVVMLDPADLTKIKKADQASSSAVIGVATSAPAMLVEGSGSGNAVVVAAAGTVSVKVSTAGGAIKAGDPLTSSNTPGVAMKASKGGAVIGRAVLDYSGEGVSSIPMVVGNGFAAEDFSFSISQLTGRVDSLEQQVNGTQSGTPAASTTGLVAGGQDVSLASLSVDHLTVNMDMFVNGSMVVSGPAEFKGSTLFDDLVTFSGDTTFNGSVIFNNNSAGYAVIKPGESSIQVIFKQPFKAPPIVTISLGDGKFATYSYRNVSEQGFEIILPGAATDKLTFSWTATAVSNPQTYVSANP